MHNKHAQKQGRGLLVRALAVVMAAVIALSLVPTRAMAE